MKGFLSHLSPHKPAFFPRTTSRLIAKECDIFVCLRAYSSVLQNCFKNSVVFLSLKINANNRRKKCPTRIRDFFCGSTYKSMFYAFLIVLPLERLFFLLSKIMPEAIKLLEQIEKKSFIQIPPVFAGGCFFSPLTSSHPESPQTPRNVIYKVDCSQFGATFIFMKSHRWSSRGEHFHSVGVGIIPFVSVSLSLLAHFHTQYPNCIFTPNILEVCWWQNHPGKSLPAFSRRSTQEARYARNLQCDWDVIERFTDFSSLRIALFKGLPQADDWFFFL